MIKEEPLVNKIGCDCCDRLFVDKPENKYYGLDDVYHICDYCKNIMRDIFDKLTIDSMDNF